MLRIHFTAADLSRVRLAASPDPMWEMALSMHVVQSRNFDPLLSGWRRNMLRLLHPAGKLQRQTAMAFALNPPLGYFPDFLTPHEAYDSVEAGLASLLATPKARLGKEIEFLGKPRAELASGLDDLRRGSRSALTALGDGLRSYFGAALAPLWLRIAATVDADRAVRAHQFLLGGIGRLLDNLAPTVRFQDQVLEVHHVRRDSDLHLNGRGLVLIPSFFKEDGNVMLLADPSLPPVVVYPVDRHIRVTLEARHQATTALIGATRAAILEMAATGVTATHAAHQLRMTISAASRHLAVLANAGLVYRVREGNRLHHLLSPLGLSLLSPTTVTPLAYPQVPGGGQLIPGEPSADR